MSTTTTTNMGMVLPVPSSEPGPAWASELVTALNLVDTHDHSSGKGVKVTPSGFNMNGDLPFNSMNASTIRALRFDNQAATLSGGTEIRQVYVANNELYYNDNNGTAVKITSNGFVNVTGSSGIGGDYASSGAALNYVDATSMYEFYDVPGTSTFANLKFLDLNIRGSVSLITTAIAANYPFTDTDNRLVASVDTSAISITLTLPNPVTRGRLVIVKDRTGSSETRPITVNRFAAETIDGAASKSCAKNYGCWIFVSDGTNWLILKDDISATSLDKTSYTQFDGSTAAGSDAIPTTFASPTLSAAALSEGTAVTRSTNDLTFPFTGKYIVDMDVPFVDGVSAAAYLAVRLRNTTDSTTAGSGEAGVPGSATAKGGNAHIRFGVDITNIAKVYQVQWAVSSAMNATNTTVNGETPARWRIMIQKVKTI